MFRPGATVLLVVLLVAARAQAQEWPEFRGPTGQGHAGDRGVPFEWSETRNVAWKTPVPGLGWSSPVVGGGRVWLTTATGDRDVSLRAIAFDIETGRELWKGALPASGKATPMTFRGPRDGRQYVVVAAGGDGELFGWSDAIVAFRLP